MPASNTSVVWSKTRLSESPPETRRARRNPKVLAKPQNQYSTGEEKDGRGGESGLDVEGAPEEADEEAGEEIAHGIDSGEGAEGHAVLLLGDELGGERIFERVFGADGEGREGGNYCPHPKANLFRG